MAQVTHELKAPLAAIRGALDLICAGASGPVPEAAVGLLAIARANSDRLLELIDDCLAMEALSAGRIVPSWQCVDADDLLREAIRVNACLTPERESRFVLGPSAPGAQVHTDRRRAVQILTNLLSNAVKYSPPGCPVRLTAHRGKTQIRFSVRDKGPGIPAWFRPQIFRRFVRAPETASVPGTGLGLFIARGIANVLGGNLGFHCPPEGGTIFHLTLPLADPTAH